MKFAMFINKECLILFPENVYFSKIGLCGQGVNGAW